MLAECMYDVTSEQIGQAYKCFEGSKAFYKVVNSANQVDDDGHLIEYKVTCRYDVELKTWAFNCSCLSGFHNFKNVKHPSKVCWHVRAALACAREVKLALKSMSEKVDAEKIVAEMDALTAESVTTSEEIATEVVTQPVTSNVTTFTPVKVPAKVARDLRAKTASRAATWNNGHMSTIPESRKPIYAPHRSDGEYGALMTRPFNFYR